jgi:putative methyltransferase (TIGR04325 family)
MSREAKTILRRWIAPDLVALANAALGRGIRFKGEFASWEAAKAKAAGYEEQSILDRAITAAEAVRDGFAAWDRDGATFSKPDAPFPLLAGLLGVAARDGGRLSALDFGGALGSTYSRCKPWLRALPDLSWTVVEQEHYVVAGRARFEVGRLRFASTIEEAAASAPNVALLCSVLQYLPDPVQTLRDIARTSVKTIIIDRTPVIEAPESLISVQHVPAQIIASSYPAHLFTRADLLAPLAADFEVLTEFDAEDGAVFALGRRIAFKGVIFSRRESAPNMAFDAAMKAKFVGTDERG